jgi:hypothetical protein
MCTVLSKSVFISLFGLFHLASLISILDADVQATTITTMSSDAIYPDKASQTSFKNGHQVIRDLLGSDVGQMQYDTAQANSFRAYLYNSLLITSSSTANNSYGSSDYNSGSGRIQFCSDGTFTEVLSGHISIEAEGVSVTNYGDSVMPGVWEVASLPNGLLIILMYSTHPRMLEDSPNGLLPFPVEKYGEDFVALPNNAGLYRRTLTACQ